MKIFVANAKASRIDVLEYHDEHVSFLSSTDVGSHGMPLTVAGDSVFVGLNDPQSIRVFSIEDASLTPITSVPASGRPVYIAVSPDGKFVVNASYHDGLAEAWKRAGEDLVPVKGQISAGNLHSAVFNPDGSHCYLASLADDQIIASKLSDGGIEVVGRYDAPAESGSRHMVFDEAGRNLYVVTEFSGEILHYLRDDDGSLTLHDTHQMFTQGLTPSRLGADPRAEGLIWAADIRLDSQRRLLYASERNRATISAFRLNADGSIAELASHSDVVAQPRGFAVLPDGNLLVASETNNIVGLYRADEDGLLELIQMHDAGAGATWIGLYE